MTRSGRMGFSATRRPAERPVDALEGATAGRAPGRVALVHDWLTGMRGGEKVLDALCELYPEAPIFTLVRAPGSASPRIETRRILPSLAHWLPAADRYYRHFLPLFPPIVELLDLDEYDLVISSSHCAVKAVVPPGRAVHVCYCHSPMRYAWDQFNAYFGREKVGRLRHTILRRVMAGLARWDAATAGRVDAYVANSRYVAERIRRYYNRGSTIVYPPVDTGFFHPREDSSPPDASFLIVSALVPYKRLEVAIEACRRAGARLKIAGHGPEQARLQRMAGPEVEFLGWQSDEAVRDLYQRTTAVLLPGVEDFGMVPVEAQACGAPVIALGAGGAVETVIDGETGILVAEQSSSEFAEALVRVRTIGFDRDAIRKHALGFSRERFLTGFRAAVDEALASRGGVARPAGLPQWSASAPACQSDTAPGGAP